MSFASPGNGSEAMPLTPEFACEYTECYTLKANGKTLPSVAYHLVLEGGEEIGGIRFLLTRNPGRWTSSGIFSVIFLQNNRCVFSDLFRMAQKGQ